MSGEWRQDVINSVWCRWVYAESYTSLVYLFHNIDARHRKTNGITEWTWAVIGGREQSVPDTARTLEERQAWVLATWRMT